MVPISSYYLGATPNAPIDAPPFMRPQSMSQISLANSPKRQNSGGATPKAGAGNRASMPPMARASGPSEPISPTSPETLARTQAFVPTPEEPEPTPEETKTPGPVRRDSAKLETKESTQDTGNAGDDDADDDKKGRRRTGTMNKSFRFPPSTPPNDAPPVPPLPTSATSSTSPGQPKPAAVAIPPTGAPPAVHVITPASIEVPPPPPVEKERPMVHDEGDDDVGATEEIPL